MDSFLMRSQYYLLLLYCIFTLAVGFQIARILYYRHALISFQLGFLILCFVWGILRIIFWGVMPDEDSLGSMLLLWMPLNIQFATFSLLVVFYAHLVHKSSWERYTKKRFAIAYSLVNTTLLVLQAVAIVLGFHFNEAKHDRAADLLYEVQFAIAGLVFLILVAILGWYGYRLRRAIGSTAKHQMLFQVPPGLFVITVVIIAAFFSRCVFDFVNISGHGNVEIKSDKAKDQIIVFLAYFAWEIVPAALIIGLFWRIPTTHIGGISRRGKSVFMLPPSAVKPVPSAGIVSRLFNDPQRYDSDDETAGILYKGTPISYSTPTKPSSYPYSFGKNTPYATTPREETPREDRPIHNLPSRDGAPPSSDMSPPPGNSGIIPGNA